MREKNYAALWNSVAPISQLSDDLICYIFHTLRDGFPKYDDTRIRLPLVLGQVCSHWRALVVRDRTLWSTISWCGKSDYLLLDTKYDMVIEYLNRSAEAPLSVRYDFTGLETLEEEGDWHLDKLYPIIPHSLHRCKELQIYCDAKNSLGPMLEYLQDGAAPVLESLTICTQESPSADADAVLCQWMPSIFLDGAPQLRYLRLDLSAIPHFLPPIDSLVHLRLEDLGYRTNTRFDEATLNYILTLPSLETLSISGFAFNIPLAVLQVSGTPGKRPYAWARSLKHLRLSNASCSRNACTLTRYLLSRVSAPLLETFILHGIMLDDILPTHAMPDYYFPSLQTLHLLNYTADAAVGSTIPFLGVLASLTRTISTLCLVEESEAAEPPRSVLENVMAIQSDLSVVHKRREGYWPNLEVIKVWHRSLFHPLNGLVVYERMLATWPRLKSFSGPSLHVHQIMKRLKQATQARGEGKMKRIELECAKAPFVLPWPPGYDVDEADRQWYSTRAENR